MEEPANSITREGLLDVVKCGTKVSPECELANALMVDCNGENTCGECLRKTLLMVYLAWENEVIDLKLVNKNMCSRQDLAIEKTKRWKKDEELNRVNRVNRWLVGALDSEKPVSEAVTCFFEWHVFDVGESGESENWWCTACRSEVDCPEGIPNFCPNCGRRVC